MASGVPPVKNVAYEFYWGLVSQADTKLLQVNPTLATGDVKVSTGGAAFANITTLPVVTPSGGTAILVSLSSSEMNADSVQIQWIDAAGAEWCSVLLTLQTVLRKNDDLAFPNSAGNGIDVTATGGVGIDWSNVEAPTTTLNLSGTTIKTATDIATQIAALNNLSSSDVTTIIAAALTATVADSLPADGTRPSVANGILWLTRFLGERSVAGLTMTVKKENGSTTAMTFTLNDASDPTSITRAS